MKASVIIPFKNPNLKQLRLAVNSARKQTRKPLEIILINDGSDDFICPKDNFGRLVKIINLEENVGPAAARNAGIKEAKGELISFLDADDLWAPKKLELSIMEFELNPEIGMTCGNYRWMINKNLCKPFYRRAPPITYESLQRVNYVASGSVTVRKDVLEDVGYFNENYWVGEDYELWLRISKKYPVKFINKILYYYRRDQTQSSLSTRKDLKAKTFDIKDLK